MPATIPHIRLETSEDTRAIHEVEHDAFAGREGGQPASPPVEPFIVDGLRAAGALSLSVVAELGHAIVGHVAFSPVLIAGDARGWYGLGPLAVRPNAQRRGIGAALVNAGLEQLRANGAHGVVLVGDPAYYGRFGFQPDARLTFDGVPAEYFLCLPFDEHVPAGVVTYHEAFFRR